MKLTLYNTVSRKKEEFKPIKEGSVGVYCCGPTVYNYAHIGNLRTYIFEDVLRRVLEFNGFKVNHIMNITDVGHLTSDADSGEDKMLKGARREGKSVWELAKFYEDAFFSDLAKLNILAPVVKCKATEHINEMIELVKKIDANGYTYNAEGNVYFNVLEFKDYGKIANLNLDGQEAGARVEVDSAKRNKQDFVLWFTKSKFGEQEMQWDSPWGRGYPGWHIECSAMSMKYLGEQFDIHCGGIDHIPIHHTNEIAQSEAATGKKPWVKYWLHGEFLVLEKEKMAKSGDNFLTLSVVSEKGYEPLVYRYFCFGAHYRQQLKFSWEGLDGAKNTFLRLREKVLELKELHGASFEGDYERKKTEEYMCEFTSAVNDDLNMPIALRTMWSVLRDEEITTIEKWNLLLAFDTVLGFGFKDMEREKVDIPPDVTEMLKQREHARFVKDWKTADELREKIKEKGFNVLDTPDGQRVENN